MEELWKKIYDGAVIFLLSEEYIGYVIMCIIILLKLEGTVQYVAMTEVQNR